MIEGFIDWIHSVTETPARQYLASAIAVGLGIALLVVMRRLGPILRERVRTTIVELVQTIVVVAAWVGAIGGLVVIWRASPAVRTAFDVLQLSENQIVLAAVSVAVVMGAYFLTRLSKRWVRALTEQRTEISSHEREILHHVIQVIVFLTAGIVVLALWNIPVGNLLLGAGFLGIVIGLAARQTLGAMLAGFVVLFSRPFEIGDWVQVGENEGVVTEITVVNTRLQTFDGEYVIIPNDMVTSREILNRSRKGRLRIEVEVGVDYGTDLEKAMRIARESMQNLDSVLSVPEPQVICKRFDTSSVVLGLRFWIDNPSARRRWRAQTAVVNATKRAFAESDVKIPFPQRELSGREESGGFQIADGEQPPVTTGESGEESTDEADHE